MSAVQITAPATEPLTLAEVMAHLRIDSGNQEPAPAAPTAALASPAVAGNVDNGAHRWLVTFVTADGETQAGTPSAAVTVADKTINGKVSLTAIPLGGSAVTARKLYRTAAGGSTYLLLATLADNTTTTYTDNIADASLGAGAPATNSTGDPLLRALIAAARDQAEKTTGRQLVSAGWRYSLPGWPSSAFELPHPPLVSVESIKYLDPDGVLQTLDVAAYQVDTASQPGRVMPVWGGTWPSIRDDLDAVRIEYTAGYGAAADVPAPIKQWMLIAIATWYSQREAILAGLSVAEMPRGFWDGLLDPYRVQRFA